MMIDYLTDFFYDRFLDAHQRFYYPSIIFALILSLWVFRKSTLSDLLKFFKQRHRFWNASIILDYKCFILIPGIVNTLWIPSFAALQINLVYDTAELLGQRFHITPIDAPQWLIVTLFTASSFVGLDFARYIMHRAMHTFPALWQIHKVHHTATTLNPFTLFRFHPFENIMGRMRDILVLGIITGIFSFLFSDKLNEWQILGLNGIAFGFNVLGSLLRHSNVPLKYPALIENIIISPRQHQLHHSSDEQDYNYNFGINLAIWDRFFGTLKLSPKKNVKINFGVIENDKLCVDHGLLSNIFKPIFNACHALLAKKGRSQHHG